LFAHGGSKRKSERSNNQNFSDFGAMVVNSRLGVHHFDRGVYR
jgi:hypothetical protein